MVPCPRGPPYTLNNLWEGTPCGLAEALPYVGYRVCSTHCCPPTVLVGGGVSTSRHIARPPTLPSLSTQGHSRKPSVVSGKGKDGELKLFHPTLLDGPCEWYLLLPRNPPPQPPPHELRPHPQLWEDRRGGIKKVHRHVLSVTGGVHTPLLIHPVKSSHKSSWVVSGRSKKTHHCSPLVLPPRPLSRTPSVTFAKIYVWSQRKPTTPESTNMRVLCLAT